jgi:hypothetical protein
MGFIQQAHHDLLRDGPPLAGMLFRWPHPPGNASEGIDHLIERRFPSKTHRGDDDVDRSERQLTQIVEIVAEPAVHCVAYELRHRVGQHESLPPTTRSRIGSLGHHRVTRLPAPGLLQVGHRPHPRAAVLPAVDVRQSPTGRVDATSDNSGHAQGLGIRGQDGFCSRRSGWYQTH